MADLRGGTTISGFPALHKGNPSDLLDTIKTVDGTGSGLDADLLDNMQPTSSQVINSIVARDSMGNFSAGIVTATLSGNASSANKWLIARTITFSGNVAGSVSFDGSQDITVTLAVTGGSASSADTATKLATARTIGLIGDVTGSNYFDGSGNVNITTTVVDDSHNHSNSTISSLDWSKITTGKPTTLSGYGISDAATSAHLHDSRYLQLSGGSLTGDLTFYNDDDGINFYGGAKVYKKTGAGLRIKPNASSDTTGIIIEDSTGTNIRLQVKTDGSSDGLLYNGAKVWHLNNDGAGSGLDADKLDGMQPDTSNTINTIIARDANGNFSAGTITANLIGNATTSDSSGKWITARKITLGGDLTGNVLIDGSADVTLTATVTDANIDHGSIGGLGDDDHTQYLNNTRHDTTTRHTLGTVIPHDSFSTLTDVSLTALASNNVLYYDTTTSKWKNSAQSIIDHGSIGGLTGDDHTQYLTTTRHDTTTRHGSGVVDHGSIGGLADDDHTQYLTTTRHDTTTRHGSGVVDHGSIGGLTNDDHTQYLTTTRHDTTTRHGSTVVDHGSIGGLGDDDHTIYVKSDGTRAFTGTISGIAPTIGSHLVTKDYVDSKLQGLDWQESVKSKNFATPPATPAIGDRYIVRATATGAWAGQENKIAEWTGSAWSFIAVDEGSALFVEDEDTQYTWNATSWVTFGSTTNHNSTSGLQGGTTNQYYHLNATEYADITDNGDCTIHYHASDRNPANLSSSVPISKGGTGLSSIAINNILYSSAANTLTTTAITSFGRSLIDDADAATARTTLGLGNSSTLNVGTTSGTVAAGDDSRLTNSRTPVAHALTDTSIHTVSGLTTGHVLRATSATTYAFGALQTSDLPTIPVTKGGTNLISIAADQMIYGSAANTYSTTPITSFGRSLISNADAVATRTTLGLGNSSTLNTGTIAGTVATGNHIHDGDTLPYLNEINRRTLAGTTTSATYYAFAKTAINPISYSAHFKIVVTSPTTTIGQTMYVWVQGFGENTPVIHVFSNQKSTSATTTGLYYIRVVYPKTANNGYEAAIELYAYNTTQRDITVHLLESTNINLLSSLTASTYNSTYQSTVSSTISIDGYTTTGVLYGSLSGNASSATYATSLYNSSFKAGEALIANDIVFLASNNLWYKATIASRNIPMGTIIGRCASTYAINATAGVYLQGYYNLPTGLTGTINVARDIFIRGTISGNNFVTDGTITTEIMAGYSYIRLGSCINTTAYINYDGNNRIYTINDFGINYIDNIVLDATTLGGKQATDFANSVHSHSDATQSASGYMSAVDKTKLDSFSLIRTGSANYTGLGGYTQINLTSATNYNILIASNGTSGGDLGEVWVVKEPDCFKVYNSGSATSIFDYTIIPSTMTGMVTGSGTMAGLSNYTQINFTDVGKVTYTVDIIPTQVTDGKVGEIWVIKSTNNVKVYNTGSYVGAFDYTIFY